MRFTLLIIHFLTYDTICETILAVSFIFIFYAPKSSELEKVLKNEKEPPFLETAKRLFSTKGFTRALLAFICSISITNVVGKLFSISSLVETQMIANQPL